MARTTSSVTGAAIKSARQFRGMEARELAAEMTDRGTDISPTTMSRIERGKREPNRAELQMISEILEVPVQWLFTGPDWLDVPDSLGDAIRELLKDGPVPPLAADSGVLAAA